MCDKIGTLEEGVVVFMFTYKQLTTALLFSLIEDRKRVSVSQLCGHLVFYLRFPACVSQEDSY